MSRNELPSWDDVQQMADRWKLSSSPAELHGGLCGWLAAGGADSPSWLALVLADPGLPTPSEGDVFDRLRTASAEQLADMEFGFQPLLPEDESVTVRADALFAWCRGFLGGFGLAYGDKPLSEESQEALNDLAGLAAAQLDEDEEGNDEESLSEIEEYLRMAVLLLHAECVLSVQHRQRLH